MDDHHQHPHDQDDDLVGSDLDARIERYRSRLGQAPHVLTELASVTFRETTVRRSIGWARVMLLLAALAGLAFDLPVLVGSAQHTSQDVAVLHTAMSLGFLLTAWRPHRYARGLAPVALAAAVLLALPFGTSVAQSGTSGVAELSHLPILVGAATLVFGGWMTSPARSSA